MSFLPMSSFRDYVRDRGQVISEWILQNAPPNMFYDQETGTIRFEMAHQQVATIDPESGEVTYENRYDSINSPIHYDSEDVWYLYHFQPRHWGAALSARYSQLIFDYDIFLKQSHIVDLLEKKLGGKAGSSASAFALAGNSQLDPAIKAVSQSLSDPKNTTKDRDAQLLFHPIHLVRDFKGYEGYALHVDMNKPGSEERRPIPKETWSVNTALKNVAFHRLLQEHGFDPHVWSVVRIHEGRNQQSAAQDVKQLTAARFYFVKAYMGALHERLTKGVQDEQIVRYNSSSRSRDEYFYGKKRERGVGGLPKRRAGAFGFSLSHMVAAYQMHGDDSLVDRIPKPEDVEYGGVGFLGMSKELATRHLHRWQRAIKNGWFFSENTPETPEEIEQLQRDLDAGKFTNNSMRQRANNTLVKATLGVTDEPSLHTFGGGRLEQDANPQYTSMVMSPDIGKQDVAMKRLAAEEAKEADRLRIAELQSYYQSLANLLNVQPDPVDTSKQMIDKIKAMEKELAQLGYDTSSARASALGEDFNFDPKRPPQGREYLSVPYSGCVQINEVLNMGREKAIKAYLTALQEFAKTQNTAPAIAPSDIFGSRYTFQAIVLPDKKSVSFTSPEILNIVPQMMYGMQGTQRTIPCLKCFQNKAGDMTFAVDTLGAAKSGAARNAPVSTPFLVPAATTDKRLFAKWRHNDMFANYLNEIASDGSRRPEVNRMLSLLQHPEEINRLIQVAGEALDNVVGNDRDAQKLKVLYQRQLRFLGELQDMAKNQIGHYFQRAYEKGETPNAVTFEHELLKLAQMYKRRAINARMKSPLYDDFDYVLDRSHPRYHGIRKNRMVFGGPAPLGQSKQRVGGDQKIWNQIRKYFGYSGVRFGDVKHTAMAKPGKSGKQSEVNTYWPVEAFTHGTDEQIMSVLKQLRKQRAEAEADNDVLAMQNLDKRINQLTGWSGTATFAELDKVLNKLDPNHPQYNQAATGRYWQEVFEYVNDITKLRDEHLKTRLAAKEEVLQRATNVSAEGKRAEEQVMALRKAVKLRDNQIEAILAEARDTVKKEMRVFTGLQDILQYQQKMGSATDLRLLARCQTAVATLNGYLDTLKTVAQQKLPEDNLASYLSEKEEKVTEAVLAAITLLEAAVGSMSFDTLPDEDKLKQQIYDRSKDIKRKRKAAGLLIAEGEKLTGFAMRRAKKGPHQFFDESHRIMDGPIVSAIKQVIAKASKDPRHKVEALAIEARFPEVYKATEEQVVLNIGRGVFPEFVRALKSGDEERKILAGTDAWFAIRRIAQSFVSSVLQQDLAGRGSRRARESGQVMPDMWNANRTSRYLLTQLPDRDLRTSLAIQGITGHGTLWHGPQLVERSTEVKIALKRARDAAKKTLEEAKKAEEQTERFSQVVEQEAELAGQNVADSIKPRSDYGFDIFETQKHKELSRALAAETEIIELWGMYLEHAGYEPEEASRIAIYIAQKVRRMGHFNPFTGLAANLEKTVGQLDQTIAKLDQHGALSPEDQQILGERLDLANFYQRSKFNPVDYRRDQIIRIMKHVAMNKSIIHVPHFNENLKQNEQGQQLAPENAQQYATKLLDTWLRLYQDCAKVQRYNDKMIREWVNRELKPVLLPLYQQQVQSAEWSKSQKEQEQKEARVQIEKANRGDPEAKKWLQAYGAQRKSPARKGFHDYINIRMVTDYILSFFQDVVAIGGATVKPVFYAFDNVDFPTSGEKVAAPNILLSHPGEYSLWKPNQEDNLKQNQAWIEAINANKPAFIEQLALCPVTYEEIAIAKQNRVYQTPTTNGAEMQYQLSPKLVALLDACMKEAHAKYADDIHSNAPGIHACQSSSLCASRKCPYRDPRARLLSGTFKPKEWDRNIMDNSLIKLAHPLEPISEIGRTVVQRNKVQPSQPAAPSAVKLPQVQAKPMQIVTPQQQQSQQPKKRIIQPRMPEPGEEQQYQQ